MEIFLDQVSGQLRVDAAVVLVHEPETGRLAPAAVRGFATGAASGSASLLADCDGDRAPGDTRPRSFTIPPEGATGAEWEVFVAEGLTSGHCVPLIVKGRTDGVLGVFFRAAHEIDSEWLDYLEMLAGQLAIAIDNRALYCSLERTNEELARAYDTTLEGWSRALEHRDRETQGHSARVVELSLSIGRTMGMSAAELVDLRRGALLHDIGKMGIPDSILLKPGPLTPEEWAVMRRHPEIAYELLAPIDFLRRALDVPYCHHEHWDGSGYPRGLKGEEIPLSARIFAVVDAWDGLSHSRPYHGPWPPEQVRAYLLNQSGRKFDPAVVGVFLEAMA
jgi:response regulator RpfG family c-di-GMP phosphodiesterase